MTELNVGLENPTYIMTDIKNLMPQRHNALKPPVTNLFPFSLNRQNYLILLPKDKPAGRGKTTFS